MVQRAASQSTGAAFASYLAMLRSGVTEVLTGRTVRRAARPLTRTAAIHDRTIPPERSAPMLFRGLEQVKHGNRPAG